MTGFSKKPVLILGMSHLVALKGAMNENERSSVNLVHIRGEKYQDAFGEAFFTPGEFKANGADALGPEYVFACPFGNFHNILGLVESPIPFDFKLDETDEVDESRSFIPLGLMTDHFKQNLRGTDAFYGSWKSIFPKAKFFHFLTPPPLEGGEKLFNRPSDFPGLKERGPTKASVRMKLYRLQCRVIEEFCAARGIGIVRPPQAALTESGFLRPDRATDPTHGNVEYGRLVLNQFFDLAKAA